MYKPEKKEDLLNLVRLIAIEIKKCHGDIKFHREVVDHIRSIYQDAPETREDNINV